MADLIIPTSADLREVEQALLPRLTEDDPLFKFLPIEEENVEILMWEQRSRYTGLQQARGANGEFLSTPPVSVKRFKIEPGYYGEFEPIDEIQLNRRRVIGTFGEPATIDDLVGPAQERLLQRRLDRIRQILWTMLSSGSITVNGPDGTPVLQDSFSLQTYTATVPWSTVATATPLLNFREAQLLSRGYSVSFGADSVAFMNQTTFNSFIGNQNNADLYGKRLMYGQTVNDIGGINKILMGENLPQIAIYDHNYLDAGENVNLFIPTGRVVIMGKRPGGARLGRYVMTRNASNPDRGPGAFMAVVDSAEHGRYPRRLEVYDGHNGAPEMTHPYGVVWLSV